MKNVLLPSDGWRSLAFYLAMEEYVAERFDDEVFFLWQSRPTVIIGRNQDLEAEVNMDYCREMGIEVVRRKSGGGCVYSDEGNIMLSYISRRGDVAQVFERYLDRLVSCLSTLGVPAERSGRNDVLVNGLKVSGNAFHQLPDRSIVHGTLLYSTDFSVLERAIMPPVEKLVRHGIRSVRQRVGNLCALGLEDMGVEGLKLHLADYFTDGALLLEPHEVASISALMDKTASVLYSPRQE